MKPALILFMSSVGVAYGGSETYTINIAKHLCNDFHIKIILGKGRPTEDFIRLAREHPIEFLSVPFISRYSKFLTIWRKTRFQNKINDFDIESLSVMASIKKIKKFIDQGDILEVQYPTESLIFPFIKKNIKKVIHFHGYALPPLYRFFNKKINNFIDSSITNSFWSKTILEKLTNLKNMKVIYNGVDTSLFKPMDRIHFKVNEHYNQNLPRFGTVGRLSKAKGIDMLINIAKEMECEAEFFAAGPYEEEIQGELKKLNIKNFHLLGPLPNNLLPFFYNFMDCYILPSLFEAFGITIIEAMACNRPVIASNVGGIPEIIEDNKNGMLITPGDYKSLKNAIELVVKNKSLRMYLAEQGRQKVIDKFTLEKTCKDLKEFYFQLLN